MRILVIRGGALGDFLVTLPMLRLLREKWPEAHIEWLGHPHLAEIGLHRYYLNGVRSVNHGPLAAFFTPQAVLDPGWMDYIGSFDLVLSYFYDPDHLFLHNLERCKPGRILTYPPQVPPRFDRPAARHFAQILEPLGLALPPERAVAELRLTAADEEAARAFLAGLPTPKPRLVAIHPGSGSETKNWPVESWAALGRRLMEERPHLTLLLIEGEADAAPGQFLAEAWKDLPLVRARLLPLPILAALLRRSEFYLGHDSGISHLAAASRSDLPVTILFGPTNPAVWAPPRPGVRVLQGEPALSSLTPHEVWMALSAS